MALKLTLNQPVELALTRCDPKAFNTPGKPPCVMYSVALPDGREDKLFLPPSCARSIDELQLQPREPFTVVRRKTPEGTEYVEVQTSAKWANSRTLPATSASPAPKPPQSATEIHHTQASSTMGAALIAAIDATHLAREYAAAKGVDLAFSTEDLRALASTIFISSTREQARNSAAA